MEHQSAIPDDMKFRCIACLCVASFALWQPAFGQDFSDLDFNSTVLVPPEIGPSSLIEFAPAFPGWNGYIGTNVATQALSLGSYYLDSSGIGLTGFGLSNGSPGNFDGIPVYFGAMLEAGFTLSLPLMSVDTTLSQTGLIPPGTQSLLFYADFFSELNATPNDFAVTLDGQTLSLIPLATGFGTTQYGEYTLYGADLSGWAGQTATLAFTDFAQRPHDGNNYLFLADIQFSPSAVPEPAVFSLLPLSGLLLGVRRFVYSS